MGGLCWCWSLRSRPSLLKMHSQWWGLFEQIFWSWKLAISNSVIVLRVSIVVSVEINVRHYWWGDPRIYHHHHHVVPLARISLTLSRHFYLSFIAPGRSSGLRPVSSHSCCMYVRAGRPASTWPYTGVHRSTSLELVLDSPSVSCVSGSSNLHSFRDGGQVAV